jgi:sulfate/thiosulfate transport system substrate-binding protein
MPRRVLFRRVGVRRRRARRSAATRITGAAGRGFQYRALPMRITPCLLAALALGGCKRGGESARDTITVAGYTAVQDLLRAELLPEFARRWEARTGRPLDVEQSYLGSGAQVRAILSGLEADVAVLSMEPDVQRLVDAGLVPRDWAAGPSGAMVSRTLVVIATPKGNPLHLRDFASLGSEGVAVMTPDPRSSGGGMWNALAVAGAARRGGAADGGLSALSSVLRRVKSMDKGARESLRSFERGVGDAAITYQSELRAAARAGAELEEVLPPATLVIESPAVVVEANAVRHGALEPARELVRFLASADAQQTFARAGFLGPGEALPAGAFTVKDLGGWPQAMREVFDKGGLYDRAVDAAQAPSGAAER